MENIFQVLNGMDKVNGNEHLDQDVKTTINWSELRQFAESILKLDSNLTETSLDRDHLIERKAKALRKIVSK